MMRSTFSLLLCLSLATSFLAAAPAAAQEEKLVAADTTVHLVEDASAVTLRGFNSDTLAKYKSDPRFNYEEPDLSQQTGIFGELLRWFVQNLNDILNSAAMRPLWRILPYLLVALAVFLVVSRLLKTELASLFYRKGGETSAQYRMTPSDIAEVNFAGQIEAAVQESNYRLAVRLLYLSTLQLLNRQGVIDWKRDKTNSDYVLELSGKEIAAPFADITRVFEYIWYGDFPLDATDFQRVHNRFQTFETRFTGNKK